MAKKKKNSDGYDGDSYDTGGQLTLDDQLFEADKKHYRDTEQYVGQVDYLYKQAITDLANLASQMQQLPQSQSFEFSRNPRLAAAADSTIRTLAARIEAVVDAGCRHEWEAACIKGDQYIQRIHATSGLSKEQTQRYQDRNLEALAAFQERKVEGLNLSERVWKMVSPLKDEVELAVDTSAKYFDHGTGINTTDAIGKIQSAIGTGMSAADLSRDVRQCLLEPNRLFRRVKDKHGNLTLSKAAKLYHPGQGVYRSSYKNAMRLTRSEINMAYRQSDTMRWQQLDFVVGMEVHTSNNHTTPDPKGHGRLQLIDICDELKGKYPRDFKFVGWHPQCRCYMTPILKTREEMNEDRANADDPSYIPKPSVNAVNDTPEGFHQYMKENEERMKGWSSTPYYIKDNPHYFDKALHPEKYQVQALTLTTEQSKALSEFQAYGNSHQSSKKFAAAMERAQKAQLAGDTDGFEAAMKEMEKIQKTNERVAEYHQKKREQKPNPKEQRHQFDDRIEAIKAKAAQYPGKAIDITSIQEAYTQLDLARLQKAIEAQEEVVRRHEKVLAAAEKRHAKRTEAQEDHIFAAWHARKPELHVLQMKEPELRRLHSLLHISTPYNSSSTQLEAVEIFSEMNNTKEAIQRYASRYKQENIQELLEAYNNTFNWESQALLAERIRLRCTAQAKADLEKMHAVDGLTFVGTTRNRKVGTSNTYHVKGQTIMVTERHYDLITFKDSLGQTYSYPLGVTKADVKATVDAGKAAVEWAKKPKYIHDNNQGFIFINDDHPMDAYYRVAYDNFTRGAMYSSDPVTVHVHYDPKDFADTACHEVGHHIYYRNSLETKYEKAKAKDPKGKFPTSYSKEATTEDFAESIKILNEGEKRVEWFKQKFPNRYEFIRTHVPGFEGAAPPSAKTGKTASARNGNPSTAPARKLSAEEQERLRIEELFDSEQNRYAVTYTKDQKENNAQIEIILGQRQKAYMDHQQADSGSVNPEYSMFVGYDINCAISTTTYELRRRGFNVKAKLLRDKKKEESFAWLAGANYENIWEGIDTTKVTIRKGQSAKEALDLSMKSSGRYHIEWDELNEDRGHIIVAEKLKDGTIILYDPQSDEYIDPDIITKKKNIKVHFMNNARIKVESVTSLVETYKFNKKRKR